MLIGQFQNIKIIKENVKQINQNFVVREKRDCKGLFAEIFGLALDEQQQDAAVIDEDHNLVIAGAGSGETLTITGKVKYLCEYNFILCCH